MIPDTDYVYRRNGEIKERENKKKYYCLERSFASLIRMSITACSAHM